MVWRLEAGALAWVALGSGCTGGDADLGSGSSDGGSSDGGRTSATSSTGSDVQICEGEGGWTASGGGDSSGDPPVGMDDDMPLAATIPEIQQGGLPVGSVVLLSGVVITTPLVPGVDGHELFVQDPAGGAWSGLRVRVSENPLFETPRMGDAVDVVGRVIERAGFYALSVGPRLDDLVPLGPGVPPPSLVVAVDELRIDDPEGRAYEGIPIRVEGVVVTDADPCEGEFVIEHTARVDDRFAPARLPSPPAGSMLVAVEGVLVYAGDAFEIGPRSPSEVQ